MLIPAGLRMVGAYAAAADESPAALAQLARQLDSLLPPQLVSRIPQMTKSLLSFSTCCDRHIVHI